MIKRAINHHIVPKVLQRNFAYDKERIWRAKRGKDGLYLPVESKNIKKVFVSRDYYTVLEGNKKSDRIEREFYGQIDDFLGQLLPEIISILNGGGIPSFSKKSLSSIREVALHMAKRTPDFMEDHDDSEIGKELVETVLQSLPSDAPLAQRNRLKADLANPERLKDRGRDIRVTAGLKHSPKVIAAMSDLVPRWAISQSKHSYILSSRMVYRIGNGGSNGLNNPNMEMWMPITPKIALVLVRDPENKIPHRVVDTPKHIRKVNEYAVENSYEVSSPSERLLNSLLQK